MTPSQPLACPSCGYDLGSVPSEAGTCPECGGAFTRTSIAADVHASMRLSLSLVSFGAIAVMFMHAVGLAFTYLPRNSNGQAGDAGEAARVLALVPRLCFAYGAAVLALTTGRSVRERRLPAYAAAAFALAAIVRVSTASYWSYVNYSAWLQPERWRTIADWCQFLAEGSLVIATAWTFARFAAALGAARLRVPLRLAIIAAAASMMLGLLARLHALYLTTVGSNLPGSNPMLTRPFFQTDAMTDSLTVLGTIAWWMAWGTLGFAALHVRAVWRALGVAA